MSEKCSNVKIRFVFVIRETASSLIVKNNVQGKSSYLYSTSIVFFLAFTSQSFQLEMFISGYSYCLSTAYSTATASFAIVNRDRCPNCCRLLPTTIRRSPRISFFPPIWLNKHSVRLISDTSISIDASLFFSLCVLLFIFIFYSTQAAIP